MRIERLAEHADALGKDDAVQAVLQAVVLAADVQLSEGVLGDTRRLQDDLVQQGVVAAGQWPRCACVDGVGRRARLGLDPARASFSRCAVMTTSLVASADEFPDPPAPESAEGVAAPAAVESGAAVSSAAWVKAG